MKKNCILILFAICLALSAQAQEKNDSIAKIDSIEKAVFTTKMLKVDTIVVSKTNGKQYWYKSEKLNLKSMDALLQNNTAAYEYFRKFKAANGGVTVMGFLGGALIGFPVGTYLGGGKPAWEMAIVGAGVLVLSVPFALNANVNLSKAISTFNEGRKHPKRTTEISSRFGLSPNGVSVAFQF